LKQVKIQNIHPKLKVKKRAIQLLVKDILTSEKADLGVDIIFVDDEFMRQLNRRFTRKDRTTDVLSFGMREQSPGPTDYPSLGDVYVSLDQAKRQASLYKVDFDEEVALLVTHGLLHILGYDHRGENEKNIMRKKEEKYLKNMVESSKSG
jgi:probable rRNA maturation factor